MRPHGLPKLLIVDDERLFRHVIQEALGGHFEIAEASSGWEALRQALNSPPDIILLDLMLPEIGGFVLCETFKQIHKTQKIPIVMLTGCDTEENRRIALESGAAGLLGKPPDLEILRSTLNDALGGRTSERRACIRVGLNVPVRIEIESAHGPISISTMTEDLSATGMRFSAGVSASKGDPITIFLLTGVPNSSSVFGARGRIAWVNDSYAPLIRYGAELVETSPDWVVKR